MSVARGVRDHLRRCGQASVLGGTEGHDGRNRTERPPADSRGVVTPHGDPAEGVRRLALRRLPDARRRRVPRPAHDLHAALHRQRTNGCAQAGAAPSRHRRTSRRSRRQADEIIQRAREEAAADPRDARRGRRPARRSPRRPRSDVRGRRVPHPRAGLPPGPRRARPGPRRDRQGDGAACAARADASAERAGPAEPGRRGRRRTTPERPAADRRRLGGRARPRQSPTPTPTDELRARRDDRAVRGARRRRAPARTTVRIDDPPARAAERRATRRSLRALFWGDEASRPPTGRAAPARRARPLGVRLDRGVAPRRAERRRASVSAGDRSRPVRRATRRRRRRSPSSPRAMRSLTSRPAALRASWTTRTSSRANPSRRSSGVSVSSSATVTPPSRRDAPSLERLLRRVDVGGRELDRRPVVDRDRHRLARGEAAGERCRRRRRRARRRAP